MSMFRAALGLLLVLAVGRPCLAEDDPDQALAELRKELQKLRQRVEKASTEFAGYKAAKDAEVAELTERATAAVARARATETELGQLRARLDLARSRHHDLEETAATLAEEVKQANAVNAKNRAWLEKMSREKGRVTDETRQRLATDYLVRLHLPNAIETYRHGFKRLPPMSVKELNLISRFRQLRIDENGLNECSETLVVALKNPDFPAPLRGRYLPTRDPFGNTDSDQWNQVPDGTSKSDALEIVDAWGHPVVYIHKNQYREAVRIVNGKGVEVQVVALRRPDGAFYKPTSYQILSLGPNGVQETTAKALKDSDDIRSFEIKSK